MNNSHKLCTALCLTPTKWGALFVGYEERGSCTHRRQGFIQRVGPGIPPPTRNLEIEYSYYCFVTGIKQQSCPRLRQKQSEFKIFLGGVGGGGGMPPDPPSRHTCLCVCEGAFARYYHPATILFSPNSKSCMKPWTAKSLLCLTLSSVLHPANG